MLNLFLFIYVFSIENDTDTILLKGWIKYNIHLEFG
jgi:hypothetical protein